MLNKLILRALLSLSLMFSVFGASNAALITQEFISDTSGDIIGSITINTVPSEDAGFSLRDVFVWDEFNFFGIDMLAPAIADGNQFIATFDSADFSLGLQDLFFDVDDVYGHYAWNGFANTGAGAVDVFDLTGAPDPGFVGYTEFTLGNVSVVPTPTTIVLFITAIAGLSLRRSRS